MVKLYAEHKRFDGKSAWLSYPVHYCQSGVRTASAFKLQTTLLYIVRWAELVREAGIPLTIYNFKRFHTIVYRGPHAKLVLFLFRPIFHQNFVRYMEKSKHKFITLLAILCVNSRRRNGTNTIPTITTFEELTKKYKPKEIVDSFGGNASLNFKFSVSDYERAILLNHNNGDKK